MAEKKGYVYLFAGSQGVKIGSTTNKERRIKEIGHISGNKPGQVIFSRECSNYRSVENFLHKKFASQRTHGEWFNVSVKDASVALWKCKFHLPIEIEINENEDDPFDLFLDMCSPEILAIIAPGYKGGAK